ncbi:SPOC domain-like protein [Metschnikowia bicuspidata var. bicuspidata NRRL YB-4993]|uniref:DNA helicase n=1 Tax=Metschnikowia bicuspidata var. bicuspidata NRRL YB-4993 TaxID=869754 RepID=A0A1A0GYY6_9ASCO|nr:SPOC domain-like protein [Metschnikowia bicuspidata var. bicuspidata NRRL YB-4993]OBA16966.1 SPOC domain-like protein [Metschnikowia bicuspidata var. bicuspidata NRRL YB-4993]
MFPESTVVPVAEAATLCWQHPAIRKTRPVALYMGDMRLGSDFARVLDDTSYSARTDDSCVAFRVEVHAAARADTHLLDMHEYLVDSDLSIAKVDQASAHFAWEQGPAPDAKTTGAPPATDTPPATGAPRKVPVALRSLTPAFKFSNFDLVALDPGLQRAAALQLFSALDVFGFIPERRVSPELLTGEALYVTPDKASSVKNTLGFQAFCDALRTRKLAALCRFVRKQEKEVEVGVAYAVRVKSSLGHTSCFVFVRLPYREDEKIGRFPLLSGPADAAEPQPPAAALLMDAFVNEKTYESDHELSEELASHDVALIDNFKVTMKTGDSSKLPRPPVRKGYDPFICSSPSAARHQAHMRQILLRSLGAADWVRHFDNPRFVADNLRGLALSTNFFNLRNCLAVNSQALRPDWLLDLARKSHDSSKRLASELGCTYVRKADSKKAKTQASAAHLRQKGNYGADEGDYDEIPDFGF